MRPCQLLDFDDELLDWNSLFGSKGFMRTLDLVGEMRAVLDVKIKDGRWKSRALTKSKTAWMGAAS
jgi:hypothetical protein